MSLRPTDAGNFAEAVYAQMAPVAYDDENQDWHLLIFLGAIGQMYEDMNALAHYELGPWLSLLDIDQIPDVGLLWFGQFVGVRVDGDLSYDLQRQQIRDHVGWGRGRPKAVKDSIRPRLSDSQTVELVERDTSPYHFTVVTYDSETPAGLAYNDLYSDFATYNDFYVAEGSYYQYLAMDARFQILEILDVSKPGGTQYTWTIHAGSPGTYQEYFQLWENNDSYQEVFDDYQTYQVVYLNP